MTNEFEIRKKVFWDAGKPFEVFYKEFIRIADKSVTMDIDRSMHSISRNREAIKAARSQVHVALDVHTLTKR